MSVRFASSHPCLCFGGLAYLLGIVVALAGNPVTAPAAEQLLQTPIGATNDVVTTEIPAGFVSKNAQLPGVNLHYLIGGSGPPMLLIHGWPETWYEWRKMMPLLAARFTVVVPDLRGMGDSSLEPSGYDKKTLAQDLHGLMVKLGYLTAVVVGHDWGAPIAYAYAAQFRDGASHLIMAEGAPFGSWTINTAPMWFFGFLEVPNYAEDLLKGREKTFLRYFYVNPQMHAVPGAFDEKAIDVYTRAYARDKRMQASYGLYRAIPQDIKDDDMFAKTALKIPVLAIGAQAGNGKEIFLESQHVAPTITTLLMESTGHFIAEERPEVVTQFIEQFVDGKMIQPVWHP